MTTRCFYHKGDFDGIASGAIVRNYFGDDCVMHPIEYGEEFPWDVIEKNDAVFMCDFSIQPYKDMKRLYESCSLVWIDHHETAINAVKELGIEIAGIQKSSRDKAACELTWEWLHGPEKVPYSIRLLSQYDVWDHSDPNCLAFQYGIRGVDKELVQPGSQFWYGLIRLDYDDEITKRLIEKGRIIVEYVMSEYADYAKKFAFECEFEGLGAICINRKGNSKMFDAVFDPDRHDIMLTFVRSSGGYWVVTLYSDNRDTVHCGELAIKHGGGGHRNAAGFQTEKLWFL